jgi:FixJ family two-component response regulator
MRPRPEFRPPVWAGRTIPEVERLQANVISIVDDNPWVLKSVDRLLRAAGYDTELFSSGEAFLDRATSSAARCLLIDIDLGTMSGIDLARHLATRGFVLPVIFMSGRFDHEPAALAAGCVAFLRKPFPANLLLEAVEKSFQVRG